jgi:hypothetical protein
LPSFTQFGELVANFFFLIQHEERLLLALDEQVPML